jgi:hypothetical protein
MRTATVSLLHFFPSLKACLVWEQEEKTATHTLLLWMALEAMKALCLSGTYFLFNYTFGISAAKP